MPENSDSVGRTFESCWAYQNAVKSYDFTAFLYRIVPIICFYCVAHLEPDTNAEVDSVHGREEAITVIMEAFAAYRRKFNQ